MLAGRGWGKTRTGGEWVNDSVRQGRYGRFHLIAPTAADVRDVMVEGEAGILRISQPYERPHYEPSKRRLTWPNGATASLFSADEPDRLRGPQCEAAWLDEVAAWKYPETYDMHLMGLRLGTDPRQVVTTTPRPIPIVRDLVKNPTTAVTRGTTYENRANLAVAFFDQIIRKYEGTRLGRQELHAEILDDIPGALWTRDIIRTFPPPRIQRHGELELDLARVVVAIDPAVTSGEDSDETGIVVAGVDVGGRGHILADRSCRLGPDAWARRAIQAYRDYGADRIVAEVNNGGDMVESVLRAVDPNIPYTAVHASRGKRVRAEPVAALYEQGKVTHAEVFPELEDQLCTYTPESGESPDRLDALVWAITHLMLGSGTTGEFSLVA